MSRPIKLNKAEDFYKANDLLAAGFPGSTGSGGQRNKVIKSYGSAENTRGRPRNLTVDVMITAYFSQVEDVSSVSEMAALMTYLNSAYSLQDGDMYAREEILVVPNQSNGGSRLKAFFRDGARIPFSWSKKKAYKKFILPRLKLYYAATLNDSSVDTITKNVLKSWWETEQAQIEQKAYELSTFLLDDATITHSTTNGLTITATNLKFDGNVFGDVKFFTDLFNASITKDASTKKRTLVLEHFGFSEYIAEKDDGWFRKNISQRSIDGLETAAVSETEWYKDVVTSALGLENGEKSFEDILNLRQCALATGLLHKDSGLNFHNYINDADYSSPLSGSGLDNDDAKHNRIYPVEPYLFDPNTLMNRALIHEPALELFKDKNNIKGPNIFETILFWVYEGTDGQIREVELSKTKGTKDKSKRLQVVNNIKASRIAKRTDLTSAQKASRISNLGLTYDPSNPNSFDKEAEDLRKKIFVEKTGEASKSYYKLSNTKIEYNGTNPSTARNDVKVTLDFELSSISALETSMLTSILGTDDGLVDNTDVKILDLITLPATKTPSTSNGPGSYVTNQYSPNYSRLRLKAGPISGKGDPHYNNSLVMDLAIIDHSISRSSETGITSLTINYRGYFESMLNMPFNDALASPDVITSREKRQKDGLDILKQENCKAETVRQALRNEQETFSRESRLASASSLLTRLAANDHIHEYVLDANTIASSFGNFIDSRKNYVQGVKPGKTITSPTKEVKDLTTTLNKQRLGKLKDGEGNNNEKSGGELATAAGLKNHFFFLGDLMYYALDCLYEDETATHRTTSRNLNLRFIMSTIQVPDPKNVDGPPITINPICLPVDVSFFVEWFNSTVVNKGLSFYPVGTFIRDLIEKLVNSVLYDICFSVLLPDETPPLLRSSCFSSDNDIWFSKGDPSFVPGQTSWFSPDAPYFGDFNFIVGRNPNLSGENLFKSSLYNSIASKGSSVSFLNSCNYCVIYQQSPSFMRQMKLKKGKNLKDDPYIPTLFYGTKNVNFNFLNNVSFSKTDSPHLREARYFNSNYGNLSLLSNVYDLSFSFENQKANTMFYPGNILNFVLLDWGDVWESGSPPWESTGDYENFGQANPHKKGTISNILGMGGYFIVKSVSYSIGETNNLFKIDISCKFLGTDADKSNSSDTPEVKDVATQAKCAAAFNTVAHRYNELQTGGERIQVLEEVPTVQPAANNDGTNPAAKISTPQGPSAAEIKAFEDSLKKSIGSSNVSKADPSSYTNSKYPEQSDNGGSSNEEVSIRIVKLKIDKISNKIDGTYYFEDSDLESIFKVVIANDKTTVTFK